jgi:hypothetical protein
MRFLWLTLLWLPMSSGFCQQPTLPDFAEGREGIGEMALFLAQCSRAEREALAFSLRPDEADIEALFLPEFHDKAREYLTGLFKHFHVVVQPLKKGQSEVRIWGATAASLRAYSGEAAFFPGGYKELAPYFQEDVEIFRIKFAEPDRYLGASYDAFAYVNGHWKLFPQVWKALQIE